MLTAALLLVAIAGVWGIAAVAFAFLAAGVIHERDHHDARAAMRRRTTLVAVNRPAR